MLGIWCFVCFKNENHSSLYFRKCIFPTIEFFFCYFKPRIYGQNTMHTRIYFQFFFSCGFYSQRLLYSSPEYDKWFTWFVTWSLVEWPKMRMEIMQMYHINLATISVKFKQHRLTLLVYFYYFRNWIQLIKCWLRYHCFLLQILIASESVMCFLVWKHLRIACGKKITLKMIQCTDDTWFEKIIFFFDLFIRLS